MGGEGYGGPGLKRKLNKVQNKQGICGIYESEYILPEKITRNNRKVNTQNLNDTVIKDLFVFGQE